MDKPAAVPVALAAGIVEQDQLHDVPQDADLVDPAGALEQNSLALEHHQASSQG